MGILLYLDDFGTGYSSLSYLTRMPVHALKVDRSFVARMIEDRMSAMIVQTVLALATALRMETVAEGVESAAEADVLRKAVGKKDAGLIREELGKFIEKAVARGYNPRDLLDDAGLQRTHL